MERRSELEILRRSIAMLSPGALALVREDALRIIGELADVESRFEQLRHDLRRALDETDTS